MLSLQVILALVPLIWNSDFSEAPNPPSTHDFHYSRIILDWNPSTGTWQGVLRVFTDDLESALMASQPGSDPLRLGDEKENSQAEGWIQSYFDQHWNIAAMAVKSTSWNYIGKEVEFDLTYIYVESSPMDSPTGLSIQCSHFTELFDDQVNEVSVQAYEQSMRNWLTSEVQSIEFTFTPAP